MDKGMMKGLLITGIGVAIGVVLAGFIQTKLLAKKSASSED